MEKQRKGYGLTTRSEALGYGILIFMLALVLTFFTFLGYVAMVSAEGPKLFEVCVEGGECAKLPADVTRTIERKDVVCSVVAKETKLIVVCGPRPTKERPAPLFFGTHVDCTRFDSRSTVFAVVGETTELITLTCLGGLT